MNIQKHRISRESRKDEQKLMAMTVVCVCVYVRVCAYVCVRVRRCCVRNKCIFTNARSVVNLNTILSTGWRRLIGSLIFIGHFLQK